jgi:hypothetical protein
VPGLKKQTPRQRARMNYMMDVMRRLEWDLHNTIELTGRIPEAWHEIAKENLRSAKVMGNLGLEAEMLKVLEESISSQVWHMAYPPFVHVWGDSQSLQMRPR